MSRSSADRGQTAIDFAVGMALFLLAVAFVLAFVPSMFAPFFGTGGGDALVADRSAAYLADNALVDDPSHPGALNKSAVDTLLEDDCDDSPGAYLADELGIGTESVNVSVTGPSSWSCGDAPSGSETVSTRVVTIDGDQHILRVVVW